MAPRLLKVPTQTVIARQPRQAVGRGKRKPPPKRKMNWKLLNIIDTKPK
jgi:hypothetical protein